VGNGCDPSEQYWNCYAWPVSMGGSGNRAFMTNETGDVLQSNNQVQLYSSTTNPPAPLGAYVNTAADMRAALSIGGNPLPALDGGTWVVCN
jgi:hypothetical protein